jgi:membrane-bound lytic murein transglycosylase D
MTKTKHLTGLLAHAFLFTTAAHAGNFDQEPNETASKKAVVNTASQSPKNQVKNWDSSFQKNNTLDSLILLNELYESEAAAAPKVNLNKQATSFVLNYLQENKETLNEVKKRSNSYFTTIEAVFKQYGVPEELKYLAVIESKLKLSAVSHAGAVGPWQFMPATARYLGLKVGGKYDERRHLYKSTVAAAKYLKILHHQFGDWLLVLAAYNSGAGNVYKAIRKSGSRNFWVLQHHLPTETKLHVKRFIGAHYFFDADGSETMLTQAEAASYQKALSEYTAARMKEREELKQLIQIANLPNEVNNSEKETSKPEVTKEEVKPFKEK